MKITILDIFYISLSLPLTYEEGMRTLASSKHVLFTGQKEGGREREHPRTLASIKHAPTLSLPHSVSQSREH
jgi:hypothetical protein